MIAIVPVGLLTENDSGRVGILGKLAELVINWADAGKEAGNV